MRRSPGGVGRAALFLGGLVLGLAGPAAAVEPVYTPRFGDLALGGYDAVAYFSEGGPQRGSREFEHRWRGAAWRFASEANRARFAAEPERFAPRYGGYCAWAVSRGYTAAGDPLLWKIVDEKLYLNYNKKAQSQWEEDIPGNIARADENWPTLVDED